MRTKRNLESVFDIYLYMLVAKKQGFRHRFRRRKPSSINAQGEYYGPTKIVMASSSLTPDA